MCKDLKTDDYQCFISPEDARYNKVECADGTTRDDTRVVELNGIARFISYYWFWYILFVSCLCTIGIVSTLVIYNSVGQRYRPRNALAPGAGPVQRWFGTNGGPYAVWYRQAYPREQGDTVN